jgi:hypothetical protein
MGVVLENQRGTAQLPPASYPAAFSAPTRFTYSSLSPLQFAQRPHCAHEQLGCAPHNSPTLCLCLSPHHNFLAQALHHLRPSPLDNWVNDAAANATVYIALKAPLPSHDLLPLPFPLRLPLPTSFPLLSAPHPRFLAQPFHHLCRSPLDNWVNNAATNVNAYIALTTTLPLYNLLLLPFPLRLPLRTSFPLLSPRPFLLANWGNDNVANVNACFNSAPHYRFVTQPLYHLRRSPLDNWVNDSAANVNNYIVLMATLPSYNLLLLPFLLRLALRAFFPLLSPCLFLLANWANDDVVIVNACFNSNRALSLLPPPPPPPPTLSGPSHPIPSENAANSLWSCTIRLLIKHCSGRSGTARCILLLIVEQNSADYRNRHARYVFPFLRFLTLLTMSAHRSIFVAPRTTPLFEHC